MLRWNAVAVLHQLREKAGLLFQSRRRLRLLTGAYAKQLLLLRS
jgi:hypothetical protein